ncbi:MFS transporter [Isoalcanivorax beigongshangi]|uniref:MFS transporter n=1 Tax=Isoalcanivorax beigongshangi TaxID=3238810 RepID=A0ABV4AES3_9GAMM
MTSTPRTASGLPSRWFAPAYGMGSLGPAIFILTPQILLLFFMTEILGIPPGAAGAGILIPKLWELVFDPLLGRWSDRLNTRWGRRRPLMAVGSVVFLVAFAMMFSPPDLGDWQSTLVWVIAFYTLTCTGYSLFTVPYATLLAEVTEDPHARTKVAAWRSALLALGFLLAGALAPWLVGATGGGHEGYANMALLIGLIAFAGMASAVLGTGGSPVKPLQPQVRSGSMLAPFRNRAFSWLWLAFVIQMISVAVSTAMLPFYDKYWLGNDPATVPTLFLGLTVLTVATTWCWTWLARNFGKHNSFVLATVLYGAATASLWLAMYGAAGFWFAIVLFGIANAGQQLFCFAIVPDIIAQQRSRTGIAEEGAFTGLWIWGEKIGLALGAGLAGLILQLAGFQQGSGTEVLEQTPLALSTVAWTVSIVPGVICLLSIPALFRSKRAMQHN